MEQRLGKDEIQSAAGNLLATLHDVKHEYQHGRIDALTFRTKVEAIRKTSQRFHNEFKMAHRIMYAPTK
jgi:hypothetical protein